MNDFQQGAAFATVLIFSGAGFGLIYALVSRWLSSNLCRKGIKEAEHVPLTAINPSESAPDSLKAEHSRRTRGSAKTHVTDQEWANIDKGRE